MDPWVIIYTVTIVLFLPCLIAGSICQRNVYVTFDEYSKVPTENGVSAAEIAKLLLENAGAGNVDVVEINGKLSDCYDPRHKVVKLSTETYNSSSVAAIGVCAHEVGHAIQDHNKMFLFRLRAALVPIVNLISKAFVPLVLLGAILSFLFYIPVVGFYITLASVVLYGASLIFQLVTLPLEYNASKRALELLEKSNTLTRDEIDMSRKVLKAAIMTYVASTMTAMLYFLRFLSYAMIFAKNNRD